MPIEILEIRPRFKKLTPEPIEAVLAKLQGLVNEDNDQITGEILYHQAVLKIPQNQQRFWSPQLSLKFVEKEKGTLISGLYGPRPTIWSLFMFLYFFLGLVALALLIIGLSRYNLGLSSYILWFVPFVLSGIFVLWFSGKAGKRISHKQIYQIHDLIKPLILAKATDVYDW